MNRFRFLSFTAAAASVALLASSADAGWGSRGSYGSYGSSYGSYGSSGYSAAYASGGSSGYASYSGYASHGSIGDSYGSTGGSHGTRVGLLRRLAQHIHSHRAARHSRHHQRIGGGSSGYSGYYSGGGSSGYSSSYGSYGGSSAYGSYGGGSSGGSYGGGSSGGVIYGSSSVPYYSAGNTRSATGASYMASTAESSNDEPRAANVAADTALLTIAVPELARVIVNGHQTTSTGPIRQFMSKGLKNGYTYTYEVEVQNDVDGRTVSDRQTVTVRAGQAERLAFAPPATDDVETVVTVRVPANAEVTLAGNPTDAKGETRTFRTRQLKAGETWDDYSIQVAVMLDGRRVVKEKTISLRAGSEEELDFEFDSPADAVVAAR